MSGPLSGFRVGVTAARKADEQVELIRRRGAEVVWGPALSSDPNHVDGFALDAATVEVFSAPVDLFIATSGVGLKAWFTRAEETGVAEKLYDVLGDSEILARGPKSVGVLRRHGLREVWSAPTETFDDVIAHLRGRDLSGKRIVVQEHGQSLSMVAHALRRLGADAVVVTVYRVVGAESPERLFALIDELVGRRLDAVTFTAAPAVGALLDAATSMGVRDEVLAAFQADVLCCCVGPVTAAAAEFAGIPTITPERSRLASMVKALEQELPKRRDGATYEVGAHVLNVWGDRVLLDGVEVKLTPAPQAVLQALLTNPGHVVSRSELLTLLPTGQAGSEHAVEMAVARLRAAIGTRLVQTVVKRGYRLAV